MIWNDAHLTKLEADNSPLVQLQVPQFFRDTADMKTYFEHMGVPVDINKVISKEESYYFVKAYPYSGVDTTDLYCFIKQEKRLAMYLKAFLWRTPRKEDVKFKVNGDYVDVICKGAVVLKVNPSK